MSKDYPKIQAPCPRRLSNLPTPGRDACSHCQQRVHRLDLMSAAQRRDLLAQSEQPICVAYAVPGRRTLSASLPALLGMAIAAGVGAGDGAIAANSFDPGALQQVAVPVKPDPALPKCADPHESVELITVIIGGIRDPQNAEWISAVSLSEKELPEIGENSFLDQEAITFHTAKNDGEAGDE